MFLPQDAAVNPSISHPDSLKIGLLVSGNPPALQPGPYRIGEYDCTKRGHCCFLSFGRFVFQVSLPVT